MVMRRTLVTGTPTRCASWLTARLWSSRIIAVIWRGSRSGALWSVINAFVFAGFPTTSTLTSRLALRESAAP